LEPKIEFQEADQRYIDLKQRYDNGDLSTEEFRAQLEQTMVQDAEGRWWAKHRETGEWNYFDGGAWIRDTPPGYEEIATETANSESPEPPLKHGEDRQRVRPWNLAIGLIGVVLVSMVVYLVATSIGGAETVKVPDVAGKPRNEAEKILASNGFRANAQMMKSAKEDAGKVIKQSPSDGEAKKGSTVTIEVGETTGSEEKNPPEQASNQRSGYNLIEDPTGNLTVEVPKDWNIWTGADSEPEGASNTWSYYAGDYILSSITVARSLEAWMQGSGVEQGSGAYIVASRTLAQQYTDDELIYSLLYKNKDINCTPGPSKDFERPPYSGKLQTWYDCGGVDNTSLVVVAAPEGRECVVVLGTNIAPEADDTDREAIRHILDTFEVDCGGIAGAKTRARSVEFASVNGSISPS
jgi:hypothetical protein